MAMPTGPDSPARPARRWRLVRDGRERGPYGEAFLRVGLRTGTIPPGSSARPEGGSKWLPLGEWAAFAADAADGPEGPAGPPPVGAPAAGPKPAWDPRAVAWLGLAFSPLWAAVMAGLNARRLGSGPAWRPALLAAGWFAADLAVEAAGLTRSGGGWAAASAAALQAAFLFLIWLVDLRPQEGPYAAARAAGRPAAGWLLPVSGGAPLAALALLSYSAALLLPPEPREVCRGLLAARSLEEAKGYATANLWPALADGYRRGDRGPLDLEHELAADGPAGDRGGWYVDCRFVGPSPGSGGPLEGTFHLVELDGRWKVEELYLASGGFEGPARYSTSRGPAAPPAGTPSGARNRAAELLLPKGLALLARVGVALALAGGAAAAEVLRRRAADGAS